MKKRRQIAAAMALGMMLTAVPFTTGSAEAVSYTHLNENAYLAGASRLVWNLL